MVNYFQNHVSGPILSYNRNQYRSLNIDIESTVLKIETDLKSVLLLAIYPYVFCSLTLKFSCDRYAVHPVSKIYFI